MLKCVGTIPTGIVANHLLGNNVGNLENAVDCRAAQVVELADTGDLKSPGW